MSETNGQNDSDDSRVGGRLGKYRITRPIGRGGMGVVYEAEDTVLKRRVAVKLLSDGHGAESEPLRRLLHEAQAAARLNHPNVVTIHEVNRRDGEHFIAMELVDGGSAQDFLDTMGPFNWLEATRVIADACRGLVAAHAAGLIHRDIKPANIMRSGDGVVKLADFGLAKITDRPGVSISGPGTLVGTPHYMSPEQCRFDPIDDLSDIYSLGATYFALLTGKPPYPGDLQMQVMYAHCSSPVPDPRELDERIPEKVAAIARKAMAKLPEERFRNAADMLAALDAILASVAKSRRPQPSQWSLAIKAHRDHSPADPAKGVHTRPARRRRQLAAAILVFVAVVSAGFAAIRFLPRQPSGVDGVTPSVDPWDELDEIIAELDAKNGAGSASKNDNQPKLATSPAGSSTILAAIGEPIRLPGAATTVAASAKDSRIAVACRPVTGSELVCLFEPQTHKLVEVTTGEVPFDVPSRPAGRSWQIRAMAFHAIDRNLLAVALHDGELAGVAGLRLGPEPHWESWFRLPVQPVGSLTISRDGLFVAAASERRPTKSGVISVWNWGTEQNTDELNEVPGTTALAFSPATSDILAIGQSTGSVSIVERSTKTRQSFETGVSVRSMAFANGGKFLGVAAERRLVIFSLKRNQSTRFSTTGAARSLAFFPGGTYLIAGIESGDRGSIEVFEMPTPRSVESITADDRPVDLLTFTPDGTLLSAAGSTLRQWQVRAAAGRVGAIEQVTGEQR